MARSFTKRLIGAATLDVPTYEEIEHDRSATGQAAAVVAIAAAAGAIGSIGSGSMIGGVIAAFVGWAVWAFVTLLVGTFLFNGKADLGEMLRALGFANAPGLLYILAIVPFFGGLIGPVVWLWMLICGVVAIRQALDFSTGKAIATVLIGLLPYIVARMILSGVTFGLL